MINHISIHPDAPESLREAIVFHNGIIDEWNECSVSTRAYVREVIDSGVEIDPDELLSLAAELKVLGAGLDAGRERIGNEFIKLGLI